MSLERTPTANSQTTSTGDYDDSTNDTENDTSNITQHQGPLTYTDGTTNYSHPTTDDDGTFDDTATGDTLNGTFNDGLNARTTDHATDHATESGAWTNFYKNTVNDSADTGTKTIDTANGDETGAADAPTRTGAETDDELDTDDGSFVSTLALNLPVLTTNTGSTSTYADAEHDHSVDNFTSGGTTPGDDVNYNDIDRSKGEQINTISYTEQQSGGSEGASDSRDDTQKATDTDVGQDDRGTGGETDTGTATDTDHDTDTDNSTVHSDTPQQTINDQATTGDIYDDHLTDNYNDAGGGDTDHDTFHAEDRPYGNHNDQTTNVLLSDPNVNSGTSDVGSGGEDDVDDGEADETNGLLTGETDNFNDQGHSQDTAKSNAASDQGPVSSNVQNVPWLIPPVLIMWPNNPTPFGSIMAASFSGPTTTTSNANSNDTDTDKAHANGTTTDTNGAVSTNESFGDTATDQFTDGFSQTSSGAYNGASGSGSMSMVVTNSDKGNETDTDNGTADGGVTSNTYNDNGGSSITQKTTMSENATSSGQDIQSSGQSAFTTIATQTITSNASGSDATPPGGVTAPANAGGTDANNPDVLGGFATADQKSGYTITITNSDVRSRSGTTTGGVNSYLGIFSVGDTASYKATANATISSNSVIDVNQAQGINTRGGSQNDDASETQTADYKVNYSQTLPGIGTLAGGGQSHSVHNGYNDTDGPYGTGTDTNKTGASTVITGTWWQTPGQPSSGGGTYTTGFNNKTPLAAAPAPEGQPGIGEGTTVVPVGGGMFNIPADKPARGGQGKPLALDKGPVSVVAIPGNFQGVDKPTGTSMLANAIVQSIRDKNGELFHDKKGKYPMAYTSTPGTSDANAIANQQLEQIKQFANEVKSGRKGADEIFSVVLVGHSYGADLAIDVAISLHTLLRTTKNPAIAELFGKGKIDIHLITIDAIKRGGKSGVTAQDPRFLPDEEDDGLTLKDKLASWHNYYQQDDAGTVWNGVPVFGGAKLRGQPLVDVGAADLNATTLNDAGDDVNHHLQRPADVWKTVLTDFGLPIPTVP